MPLTSRCLTLILTERCPLACRHCGTGSGPDRRADLPAAAALAAIRQAAAAGCEVVNLSGGEPMLRPRLVMRLAAAAISRGLICRVTTGAAWALSARRAADLLAPMARAGLSQVFLSAGEFHGEQQPPARVLSAAAAARSLGLQVFLALSGGPAVREAIVTAFRRSGLDVPPLHIQPLVAVGRARRLPAASGNDEALRSGLLIPSAPCRSLGRHPTLWPDGVWTGCASVGARQAAELWCARQPGNGPATALERLRQDPLWAWIGALGPAALRALAGLEPAAGHGRAPCADCLAVLLDARALARARLRLPRPLPATARAPGR